MTACGIWSPLAPDAISRLARNASERLMTTRITSGDFNDPRVVDLLCAHLSSARAETAPGSAHALDLDGLQSPDIRPWTVWDDDTLLVARDGREFDPDARLEPLPVGVGQGNGRKRQVEDLARHAGDAIERLGRRRIQQAELAQRGKACVLVPVGRRSTAGRPDRTGCRLRATLRAVPNRDLDRLQRLR